MSKTLFKLEPALAVKWQLRLLGNTVSLLSPGLLQLNVQSASMVGGEIAIEVTGKYHIPTVTWSAPGAHSNWIKYHQDTKASTDAASNFGITDPEQIRQSCYKYFALTYTCTGDEAVLQK